MLVIDKQTCDTIDFFNIVSPELYYCIVLDRPAAKSAAQQARDNSAGVVRFYTEETPGLKM